MLQQIFAAIIQKNQKFIPRSSTQTSFVHVHVHVYVYVYVYVHETANTFFK
jgi:hypothetical protein